MNAQNELNQKPNLENKLTASKLAKSFLTKVVIPWTVMANIIYGTLSYSWRQDGISEEKIDSYARISYKDPTYWLTKPGREIGFCLYDLINKK